MGKIKVRPQGALCSYWSYGTQKWKKGHYIVFYYDGGGVSLRKTSETNSVIEAELLLERRDGPKKPNDDFDFVFTEYWWAYAYYLKHRSEQ